MPPVYKSRAIISRLSRPVALGCQSPQQENPPAWGWAGLVRKADRAARAGRKDRRKGWLDCFPCVIS